LFRSNQAGHETFGNIVTHRMKKLILIVIILIGNKNFSQAVDSISFYQKRNLNDAVRFLKDGDVVRATIASSNTYQWNRKSADGLKAQKMADSLLPFAQAQIKSTIIGTWILKKSGSNWGFEKADNSSIEKVLKISKTHFKFYDQDVITKKLKLTKKEKIKFTKYPDMSNLRFDFVFSDKSLWSVYLIDKDALKLTNTGEETKNSRTELVCGNSEFHYLKRN
jgi:hypothetical protein